MACSCVSKQRARPPPRRQPPSRRAARPAPARWQADFGLGYELRNESLTDPSLPAGVLVPPQGYLQRLRQICDKHGILLIFDEVITGLGRLGAPFASQYFGVTPDLMTLAKGINNATVPMGAVAARQSIHDTIVNAGQAGAIEFFHGYTYSGHPLAAAAACAALDLYRSEDLFNRAAQMAPHFEDAIHALKGLPGVLDIRNLGLVGGVELQPRAGAPGARAHEIFVKCFEQGVLIRYTGDILAFSPPLIVEQAQIAQLFDVVAQAIRTTA